MAKFMYFDFSCDDCTNKFVDFVKPDVNPPCPKCASKNTRRACSAVSIPIKHNQWVKNNKRKIAEDKKFYDRHGVDKKHHSVGS